MYRNGRLVAIVLAAAVAGYTPGVRATDNDGTVVEIGNLKSRTPANWKEEAVTNPLRLAQFRLPKAEGDKQDAEVVVFQNITGSTQANIERWKAMFIPPEGKTMKEAAKVTEMKVAAADVTILDVHGTYKFKARPFDPNAKEELRPDFRMLGVVFHVNDKPYQIRFVGPAKTVGQHKKEFDEWLKAFK